MVATPSLLQGNAALCASNHRFVTVTSDDRVMAVSEKAKEREMLIVSVSLAKSTASLPLPASPPDPYRCATGEKGQDGAGS